MIENPLKFSEHTDFTTFCCEIQPAWLRSNKNQIFPNTSIQGPTKSLLLSCQRTISKMCRHDLTGYISHRMEANTDFFYLVGLEYYLLKYNGCQLVTAEKRGLLPTLQQWWNIASNLIIYKLKTTIISILAEQWAQFFVRKFFINSPNVKIYCKPGYKKDRKIYSMTCEKVVLCRKCIFPRSAVYNYPYLIFSACKRSENFFNFIYPVEDILSCRMYSCFEVNGEFCQFQANKANWCSVLWPIFFLRQRSCDLLQRRISGDFILYYLWRYWWKKSM